MVQIRENWQKQLSHTMAMGFLRTGYLGRVMFVSIIDLLGVKEPAP